MKKFLLLVGVLMLSGQAKATNITLGVSCTRCNTNNQSTCVVNANTMDGTVYSTQQLIGGVLDNQQNCNVARRHFMKFNGTNFYQNDGGDASWYQMRLGRQNCNCRWGSSSRYVCDRTSTLLLQDPWGNYINSAQNPKFDDVSVVCRNPDGYEVPCESNSIYAVENQGRSLCEDTLPAILNNTHGVNLIRGRR